MSPLIDPFENKSFADELRRSDRPVVVNPAVMTDRLTARRRRMRINRIALTIALPAGLVLVGIVTNWLMITETTPTQIPKSVAQKNMNLAGEEEATKESEVLLHEYVVATLEHRKLLAEKLAKLNEVRNEIESLKRVKSQQDWTLSLEMASRTEIDKTISAYEF